jgi:hypothetical protein
MKISLNFRFFWLYNYQNKWETQNLSSKQVSGGERAQRAGIFLEKIKFSADFGIWLALTWNFLQYPDFFGWQQSKLMKKLKTQL